MHFVSTRGTSPMAGLSHAISRGLAPDGGLYVPEAMPHLDHTQLADDARLSDVAQALLRPFFTADRLEAELEAICASAFDFPLAVSTPFSSERSLHLLELFHGPTVAFKDFGARMLAECLIRLAEPGWAPFTVLVATSGDTGGAAAAAFDGKPEARVVVLFPEGRVSRIQEHQLSCWSQNVLTLRVRPDFDACQALAKAAFADENLRAGHNLTSANSINIARLMAQCCYYAWSSVRIWRAHGTLANYVVPTGNLGNALACVWARAMGLPIGRIVCATNANATLADYFGTGTYEPRSSIATLATAMDVGAPSNFERLAAFGDRDRLVATGIEGHAADDAAIRAEIIRAHREDGVILCPHTAAGLAVWRGLETAPGDHWVLAATAHASKFPEVVEPLIGETVPPVPALKALLARPAHSEAIRADLGDLERAMTRAFTRPGLSNA